jgi:hypothetical protein
LPYSDWGLWKNFSRQFTQMQTNLISAINQSLGISLPGTISSDELRQNLAHHINHLINHDFEKLVYYLYRIDVDENKMRTLLEQKEGEGAPQLIADLIIERQLQKIKSRKETKDKNDIPDDERW